VKLQLAPPREIDLVTTHHLPRRLYGRYGNFDLPVFAFDEIFRLKPDQARPGAHTS
jgi:hypothetical protein